MVTCGVLGVNPARSLQLAKPMPPKSGEWKLHVLGLVEILPSAFIARARERERQTDRRILDEKTILTTNIEGTMRKTERWVPKIGPMGQKNQSQE